MRRFVFPLVRDDSGFVVSGELAIIATVGVLAMVVGMEAVSSCVIGELNDLSSAFGTLNQSYGFRSISKPGHAFARGAGFNDRRDTCDCEAIVFDVAGNSSNGVNTSSANVDFSTQQVLQAPASTERIVSERVVSEVAVEAAPAIKAIPCPDPQDEIIEERIIRRRVIQSSDCTTTSSNLKPLADEFHPAKSKASTELPEVEIRSKKK